MEVRNLVGDAVISRTADPDDPVLKEYGRVKVDSSDPDLLDKVGDLPLCFQMFTYFQDDIWFLGRLRGSLIKKETMWIAEVIRISTNNKTIRILAEGWFLFSFQAYRVLETYVKDKENVNLTGYYKRFTSGYDPYCLSSLIPNQPFSLLNTELFYHEGTKPETYAFCRLNVPHVEDEKGSKTTILLLGKFEGEKGVYKPNHLPGLEEMQRMGVEKYTLTEHPVDNLFLFADSPRQVKQRRASFDFDKPNIRYQFEWLSEDQIIGVTIAQDDTSLKLMVSQDLKREKWTLQDITFRKTDFFDVQILLKRMLRGQYGRLIPTMPMFDKDLPYPSGKTLLASTERFSFFLIKEEAGWTLTVEDGKRVKKSAFYPFAVQAHQKLVATLEKEKIVTKTPEFYKFG